jgi:hypothetical protein
MTKILKQKEKGLNRHWKNYLDKDYLGSHNLEQGEEMLLTIAKFEGEEVVQTAEGKSPKQVLYFKENVPKMILNITNGTTISSLYGSHPDKWIGKQIQVYAASIRAFGKQQEALRVRDFIPKIAVVADEWRKKLETAPNLEELKTIWKSFPVSVSSNQNMIAIKDELKSKLQ